MITDTEARRISSQWHGGGGTALYALSSTGAINTARAGHDIEAEIDECAAQSAHDIQTIESVNELADLFIYVHTHRPRGPVDGWSTLTW